MDWRLIIAWRYFRFKRGERFLSVITVISLLGVAVGVAALIVVLAVMSGFDDELKRRIIGTTSHLIVERNGGAKDTGILGYTPYVTGQVLIKKNGVFVGAIVNGIDEVTEPQVSNIRQYVHDRFSQLGESGLLVGSELARQLHVKSGDRVSLISAAAQKPVEFTVMGTFHTGLYTFDYNNVFISLNAAQRLFRTGAFVHGIAVRIESEMAAPAFKKRLTGQLGFPYQVRTWMELNRSLFSALKLEKITMFAILALIVLVACFNIASSLIVRVVERTKDIGILKAIGAKGRDIRTIFRLEGLFIGSIGTVLGVAAGLVVCWFQQTYKIVRLPSEIYYIDALPIHVNWYDPLLIAMCAVFLSWVATIYPSRQAVRLEVVDALRYE